MQLQSVVGQGCHHLQACLGLEDPHLRRLIHSAMARRPPCLTTKASPQGCLMRQLASPRAMDPSQSKGEAPGLLGPSLRSDIPSLLPYFTSHTDRPHHRVGRHYTRAGYHFGGWLPSSKPHLSPLHSFQATLLEHRTITVPGTAHVVPLCHCTYHSLCLQYSLLTPQPSQGLPRFKNLDKDFISRKASLTLRGQVRYLFFVHDCHSN